MENLEKTNIQWHSGFYGAAELELSSDRGVLEFFREYNLSKAPLRMDLLIIKKTADIQIKNEIGRMFRIYNVMEYKSPDDSLSISDYYKTMAYACLYKGLEERGSDTFRGIYYIKDQKFFDTQVIVTKRLDPQNHRSLRVLSSDVSRQAAEEFIKTAEKRTGPGDRNNIEAVLRVSIAANRELYDEIRRNSAMCDALRELMREEYKARL